MSSKYLGETPVDLSVGEYKHYTPSDWAMLWIEMYSGIDGSHHKDWLIDQIARILKGAPVQMKLAKWKDGTTNERFSLGDAPPKYHIWVAEMMDGEDGPSTYDYDCGVAP